MRRFHELAYLADKNTIDAAKMSNNLITVLVEWTDMPEEFKDHLSSAPGKRREGRRERGGRRGGLAFIEHLRPPALD
jgi:hypothetical protein